MGKVVDFTPYLLKKRMSKPKADVVVIYPEIKIDLDAMIINQHIREFLAQIEKSREPSD